MRILLVFLCISIDNSNVMISGGYHTFAMGPWTAPAVVDHHHRRGAWGRPHCNGPPPPPWDLGLPDPQRATAAAVGPGTVRGAWGRHGRGEGRGVY